MKRTSSTSKTCSPRPFPLRSGDGGQSETVPVNMVEMARLMKPPDDEGQTSAEIAAELGLKYRTAQTRIKALVAEGKLIQGWAERTDSLGRTQRLVS